MLDSILTGVWAAAAEITFAILFVALFVWQVYTSRERERELAKKIEKLNAIIYEQFGLFKDTASQLQDLVKEIRIISYDNKSAKTFKK